MGSISKEKFQSGQGMDGGTDLLQVVYGDVTRGVGAHAAGRNSIIFFLMRHMAWSLLSLTEGNGCTGCLPLPSGGRRRIMIRGAGSR